MSKYPKFVLSVTVFLLLPIIFLSCSGDKNSKQGQISEEKDPNVPKLGSMVSVNEQKSKVVAVGKKIFDYIATDKELWIYTYGEMEYGEKPQLGKFANRIVAKKGDIVKIDPSVPEIFINGNKSDLESVLMKRYFIKFKNQVMVLMEKEI